MRHWVYMLSISLLATLIWGCAQTPRVALYRPTLLFDEIPSTYNAERYAGRNGWLTAPAYFDEGQQIVFREMFYDQQGDRFPFRDYVSRRFTYVRKGRGRR